MYWYDDAPVTLYLLGAVLLVLIVFQSLVVRNKIDAFHSPLVSQANRYIYFFP